MIIAGNLMIIQNYEIIDEGCDPLPQQHTAATKS